MLGRNHLVDKGKVTDALGDKTLQHLDCEIHRMHAIGEPCRAVVHAKSTAPPVTSTRQEKRYDRLWRVVASEVEVAEIGSAIVIDVLGVGFGYFVDGPILEKHRAWYALQIAGVA